MSNFFSLFGLLFLLCSLGFYACDWPFFGDNLDAAEALLLSPAADSLGAVRYLRANMRQVKLRNTPDLQGYVVETVNMNVFLEYLNDSTEFKTNLKLSGEKVSAPWYKVRTPDKKEGWVYGATVLFLTESENQQINGLLNRRKERVKLEHLEKRKVLHKLQPDLLQAYLGHLQKISPKNPDAVSQAVQLFHQILGPQGNERTCDSAFVVYRGFFERVLKEKQQIALGAYASLAFEVERFGQANMQTDDFTRSLAANGFDFGSRAKGVYIREDWEFTLKHFYRYLSESMRQFLDLQQMEQKQAWREGERLAISLKDLAGRVVAWEEFVLLYGNFVWIEQARQMYRQQFEGLFKGLLEENRAGDKLSLGLIVKFLEKEEPESKLLRYVLEFQTLMEEGERPSVCLQKIAQWLEGL